MDIKTENNCFFVSLTGGVIDFDINIEHGCFFYIKYVPCQNGMACPQVADEKDGLQMWRLAVNARMYPKVSGLSR
jgi:hypothetical protein